MSTQADLQAGFGFTPDDLALNARGELSDRQKKLIEQRLSLQGPAGKIAFVVFALMALGFTALAFLIDGGGAEEARPFLLGFAGLMWVILLCVWVLSCRTTRDLKRRRVTVLEGTVKLRRKEVRTPEIKIGTAFMMTVGRQRFQLEAPEQFAALTSGNTYRFHVIRNGRVPLVLSVQNL